MYIIDSHTHIEGRENSPWFDPPETIIKLMDEAEIDMSIVMTYSDGPSQEGEYNPLEYVNKSVSRYPNRLIGYARINPGYGKEAEEAFEKCLFDYRMKGLKLHPLGYRLFPDEDLTVNLVNLASKYNAPVLFHCGDEEYTYPLLIERLAIKCPKAKIILGHMGGYYHVKEAIRVAQRCPNIILETSAMPYPEMIKEAVYKIGARRILYASDGPGCDPKIEVHKVRIAKLKKSEERLIFSENIQDILERVKN